MCRVLQLPRSTYYYVSKERPAEDPITARVVDIFHDNRRTYGTRRMKAALQKEGIRVSRRRIARMMREQGLVSIYTIANYKPQRTPCNEDNVANELNREFDQQEEKKVIVSDLTYVRVGNQFHYMCVLVDLFNREIIGSSCGRKKDAALVAKAFASVSGDLRKLRLFHTDRGSEFKNKLIDQTLHTFGIERSLSMKGCPYDNAVAEATFKTIKTEFVRQYVFETLDDLDREQRDYVHWFNTKRLHSTLGYNSPIEYKIAL